MDHLNYTKEDQKSHNFESPAAVLVELIHKKNKKRTCTTMYNIFPWRLWTVVSVIRVDFGEYLSHDAKWQQECDFMECTRNFSRLFAWFYGMYQQPWNQETHLKSDAWTTIRCGGHPSFWVASFSCRQGFFPSKTQRLCPAWWQPPLPQSPTSCSKIEFMSGWSMKSWVRNHRKHSIKILNWCILILVQNLFVWFVYRLGPVSLPGRSLFGFTFAAVSVLCIILGQQKKCRYMLILFHAIWGFPKNKRKSCGIQ